MMILNERGRGNGGMARLWHAKCHCPAAFHHGRLAT